MKIIKTKEGYQFKPFNWIVEDLTTLGYVTHSVGFKLTGDSFIFDKKVVIDKIFHQRGFESERLKDYYLEKILDFHPNYRL